MKKNMPTRTEVLNFSSDIEKISTEKCMSLIDSIVYYCEAHGLEVEVASSLVTSALKSKIREEAESLNLLKKTAKLPL
jgi:hypothetical protein